ncbi:hypothetical protein XENOCAPTIV_019648, partial [Xenoophorus captivus]
TMWLHVRSMGQWTNRLYEYFRQPERQVVCPKRLATSLRKRRQQGKKQVDFIWINRDQKSFEWFVSLLTKLEMDQADGEPEGQFLEMHMYMTSALSKNDMKAIGLQMALDLLAKKEEKDSITGLRTRTQPGRPQWEKVRLHLHLFVSDPSEPLLMMIHFLIKLFNYF